MKLVCPKEMSEQQARALTLCLADAAASANREEVAEAFAAQLSAIEAGLVVVDRNFPVSPLGVIDLVATDMLLRPVVVCVGDHLDMNAVCRGILLAEWVTGHLEVVAHATAAGELRREVRLWHVAREVAPEARVLLTRMGAAAPEVFTWRALALGGERWLVVQREGPEGPRPAPVGEKPVRRLPLARSLSLQSVLSEDEIEGILKGRHASDDDVTSRTPNFK